MRIKSLILFDLKNVIIHSNKQTLEFITLYSITNKTDINNLFVYNALLNILEIYKNNKNGLVTFYLFQNDFNELLESTEINYNKFIKIITKRIDFPIIISKFSFEFFCKRLQTDCPEYDEIIDNYKFLSTIFDDIIKLIKKLKFYKIEDELVNNLKERFKLISIC